MSHQSGGNKNLQDQRIERQSQQLIKRASSEEPQAKKEQDRAKETGKQPRALAQRIFEFRVNTCPSQETSCMFLLVQRPVQRLI